MRMPIFAAVAASICSTSAFAADACDRDAEQYIRDSEAAWDETMVTGDRSVATRILADDFIGVAPHGTIYDKATEVNAASDIGGRVAMSHLDTIQVRFFGHTAIAVGSESFATTKGERGRYVFTDTWMCRAGQWQIVAASDILTPPLESGASEH